MCVSVYAGMRVCVCVCVCEYMQVCVLDGDWNRLLANKCSSSIDSHVSD